jgi:hypothetical protein
MPSEHLDDDLSSAANGLIYVRSAGAEKARLKSWLELDIIFGNRGMPRSMAQLPSVLLLILSSCDLYT